MLCADTSESRIATKARPVGLRIRLTMPSITMQRIASAT